MISSFRKAFSLIENVVAIAISAVVIVGIIPAITGSFRQSNRLDRRATANRLSQEKIEQMQWMNLTDDFYDNLYHPVTGEPLTVPDFFVLGSLLVSGNEAYGSLGLDPANPDQYDQFRRLTEGSWDLDGDGFNPVGGDPDDLPGELARIRVTVAWDSNQDGIADGQAVTITQKAGF